MTDFKERYLKTPENIRLKFLEAVLMQNEKLQREFKVFVEAENNQKPGLSYDHFLDLIGAVQTDYRKYFETVDLENPDWENYQSPHSGYIEEWEAYQYASEQEFETIFDRFRSDATDRIIMQKADELTGMLIGLYEATQDAEIADEVGSFEDVNGYLLSEHANMVNELAEKLRLSAVSDHIILAAFDLFFRYCDLEYPENPYFASHFERLLITLAEKSAYADRLLSIIDQSAVEKHSLAELILLINKKTGNKTEWLQSALQFYHQNTEVAQQLLDYYFETDKGAFLKTARELFPANKYFWAEFLEHYVSPQLDENLFVQVFWQLTVQQKKIKYYKKIRTYLSETDLNNLLKELQWEKVFVVKILEVEKRYEAIKTFVEQDLNDWDYAEMISPILTIYPEFCFNQIKNKAVSTLQNSRGRQVYERIASWVLLSRKIPGFEAERLDLVHTLYNHKPNLPALKDEMRKAGLIS